MSQRSPFLPMDTVLVMTVNGQVGAQEDEWSWFYRQVAAGLQHESVNEQRRTYWPEEKGDEISPHFHFKPPTECRKS